MNNNEVARYISDIINNTHSGRFAAKAVNHWVFIRLMYKDEYTFEIKVDDHNVLPETFTIDFRELNTNNRKIFTVYEDDNQIKFLREHDVPTT